MKAVTIAKIARIVVIIAVAVVLAIPTFAGVESMKVNDGEFVMTNSYYNFDQMTKEDLASNINNVTDGNAGYTITYEGYKSGEFHRYIGVEVPTTDLVTFAGNMMDDCPDDGHATLFNPDGSTAKQQTIMGSNGFTQYITTGLKLTGSMVNMVKPSVSLDSVIYGTRNTISNAEIVPDGDSYRITIPIPYLLFATAMAGGEDAKIGLSIGIVYNSFFSAKFRLDLPLSKFIDTAGGGSVELPSYSVKKGTDTDPIYYDGNNPSEYGGTEIKQEITIDAGGLSGLSETTVKLGSFGTDDGGIIIEVNDDGKIQIMSDKENLVDALQSAREDDGSLVIDIGGSDPVVVDAEQMDSLLSMLDELIIQYPEIGGILA